jgi:hypothetical protein
MLRIRFAYSKLRLGNVTAGNYFGISVHKRMEANSKLLYSLSFHHRERKFIGLKCEKAVAEIPTKSGQNYFILSAVVATFQMNCASL